MKSAEARDAMVARAKVTLTKYRNFADLPELDDKAVLKTNLREYPPTPDANGYHTAVYAVSAEGPVVGRHGPAVVGLKAKE